MTDRDKEIEEASVDYQMSIRPNAIGGDAFVDLVYKANINPSFIAGAKWSDEHPRKGFVDIDKVCERLAPIFKDFAGYYCGQDLLNRFRKTMEE